MSKFLVARLRTFLIVAALFLVSSFLLVQGASAQCTPATNPGAKICSPANGSTVTSPVNVVVATADTAHKVTEINVYVDNVSVYKTTTASSVNTNVTIAPGTHTLRIQVWDTTGAIYRDSVSITVSGSGPPPSCSAPTTPGIVVCTPQNGATVTSPVTVQAYATVTGTIYRFELWSDNAKVASVSNSGTMNVSVPMSAGSHAWTFVARNTANAEITQAMSITVGSGTPTTTVAISPTSASVATNATQQFTATVTNNSNTAVTWSVDGVNGGNSTAGTVSTSGLYTAPASAGTHTVTATSVGDTTKSASATVTVSAQSSCSPPTSSGIVVCTPQNGATVNSPVAVQAYAMITGTIYRFELWSDNVKVASVSNSGTMNVSVPMSSGSHAWTFVARNTANSEITKVMNITVAGGSPGSVTVSPKQMVITPELTQQFTANTAVNWSVDGVAGGNATVGTISTSGLYTPPSTAGSHQITATSTADATKQGTATIYVSANSGIFTYHNDNARTGQNTAETALSPSNVNQATFGKLFSRSVDGFVFAQPLYVRGVNVSGVGVRNMVIVATQHGSVYAFDADGRTTAPLWQHSYLDAAAGVNPVTNTEVGSSDSGPEVCITSTPVIDPSNHNMYVLVRTNENGTYVQRLHEVNLANGQDVTGAASISAKVNGSGVGGDGAGHIAFNSLIENQRAALLLANGNVYIAWASHGDNGSYHGWLMVYNASTLQQVSVLNLTPNGNDGGIWNGGSGPASDSTGSVFVATGNGTNDVAGSGMDFGDTYLKVNASGAPIDYFTPYDQTALNSGDLDLGSSGVILLPDQSGAHPHILIGSGKRGDVYVVDRDAMGGFHAGSNTNAVQYLPRAVGLNSQEDQFFGTPSYWNSNVYFAGSFDHLKQFTLSGGLLSTTAAHTSPQVLSSNRSAEPVISSNGSSNGIVWVIATDTYSSNTAPLVLHAYDATNVGTELYNNAQAGSRDTGGKVVKFTTPTVVNGRVYVGTRNSLDVYGLLP